MQRMKLNQIQCLFVSLSQIDAIYTLSSNAIITAYSDDKIIQKVISLVRKPVLSLFARLPTPWREKFKSFSLDSNSFKWANVW